MKRAAGCGLDFRPCIVGRTAFAAPVITNHYRHSARPLGDGGFMTEGWAARSLNCALHWHFQWFLRCAVAHRASSHPPRLAPTYP